MLILSSGCRERPSIGTIAIGEGDRVASEGAIQGEIFIWSDRYADTPVMKAPRKAIFPLTGGRYPGLSEHVKGMRVGGVKRFKTSAEELYDTQFLEAIGKENTPSGDLIVQIKVLKNLPYAPPEVIDVAAGTEARAAGNGDRVRLRYSIWTDFFHGNEVFGKPGVTAEFVVGEEIWSLCLEGLRENGVRRIVLPRGLACQYGGYPGSNDFCGFCFDGSVEDVFIEVELLDFMDS